MITQTSRPRLYRFIGIAALTAVFILPAARVAFAAASPGVPPALQRAIERTLANHAVSPLTVDSPVWIEQEVTPSDNQAIVFGHAVAFDGTTAVIGDPNQGAVYIFGESNGVWTQAQELTPTGGQAGDSFGFAVAISGTTVLVGAPGESSGNGAVYAFAESGGVWTQTQEFTPNDTGWHYFGTSIAISSATALIGAPGATINGHFLQGATYVFTDSGGNWSQTQKLVASDGAGHDEFGYSVEVDNSTALLGAPDADVGGNTNQGAAYVFTESGGTWSQVQKLTANDGAAHDEFGLFSAISGSIAIVGSPAAQVGGNSHQGAAYVFTDSGGSWSQTQKLVASDGAPYDYFGGAISLYGSTAVIGAPNDSADEGAAYMFTESGGVWNQTTKLQASSDATIQVMAFGAAAEISGTTALIGAPDSLNEFGNNQGAAYFYGESDLGLALSAPAGVGQGDNYVSQTIATNEATAVTPAAVSVTVTVPATASFISANASQGSCSEASGTVTCAFGQIGGNGGTATANVTLKATGNVGATIENTASVSKATPALTAGAATQITQGGCAAGYSEYDGTLAAHGRAIEPGGQPYQAPAGEENGVLTAPAGFTLYVVYQDPQGHRTVLRAPGNELHRYGPAGTYAWLVKAGSAGGDFTFCLEHP